MQLTNNPRLATRVLEPAEQMLARTPKLSPAMFGRALERLVAEDVLQRYANLLEYIGDRPGPDFRGLGPAAGRIFDITTYLGQAAHHARWYGPRLELRDPCAVDVPPFS